MSYTTKQKVEESVKVQIPDEVFDDLLFRAKKIIDDYYGQNFKLEMETRIYNGNGREVLDIDLFTAPAIITMLKENGDDETTLIEGQSGDYVLAPYNSTEKKQIILMPNGRYQNFQERFQTVKVETTFGESSDVPPVVQDATTELVSEMFLKGENVIEVDALLSKYDLSEETNVEKI